MLIPPRDEPDLMSKQQEEDILEENDFQLPKNMNEKEMVLIRLPADLPLTALEGFSISLTADTSVHTKQGKFTMQYAENLSLSVGVLEKDGDDWKISPHIPSRQLQLVPAMEVQAETKLAPRPEVAPESSVPLRHAYAPVPPKKGLVRRWKPVGGNAVPTQPVTAEVARPVVAASTKKRPLDTPEKSDDDEARMSSSKRKKSAKKAKKEAKRAKKEAKKRRKSHETNSS